jgi:hypothetical protein
MVLTTHDPVSNRRQSNLSWATQNALRAGKETPADQHLDFLPHLLRNA